MDKSKTKEFAEKVYSDMAGAMTMGMAYVGVETGLFKIMSDAGPLNIDQVVEMSDLQPRYVEEWLKGMTASGYLTYDSELETFELPPEHAFLLASEGTDHYMGGLFCICPVLLRTAPKVAKAFKEGGGVSFKEFGPDCVKALDMINRGQYEKRFGNYWLATIPDIVEKLENDGRVLDVGCGVGRVSVAIANTFPRCRVTGIDPDNESIEQAKKAAKNANLEKRVNFLQTTTRELKVGEKFDLITACDCVHDFASPTTTLREIRSLLNSEGVLFVIEPKAADRIEDNINPIATVYYGFSLFHCLTQSLAEGGPGLGTCMGPEKTEALFRSSGFKHFEMLDIKSQTHLFYAARI